MKGRPLLAESLDMARAIIEGSAPEELRNRLRLLDEAASRGSAMTLSVMADTGMIDSKRSSWAQVYSSRELDIRASMRGNIGKIQESIPNKRFRVLTTEHAPEDVGRYFPDLKESSANIAEIYSSLADRCARMIDSSRAASTVTMTPSESVLHGNVVGFVESIQENVVSLLGEFQAIMGSSDPSSLATLARSHDILADGIEDLTIAISFSEKTLTLPGVKS
jgi:hypothetical protein